MKVVASTEFVFERFGYEKGMKLLKEAGHDCLDLSLFDNIKNCYDLFDGDDWREKAEKFMETAKREGITFTQSHAPFPSNVEGDDEATEKIFATIVHAIEVAGMMGVKSIIVHPKKYADNGNHWEENKEFYVSLIPYAEKAGVRVAVENMWGRDLKRGYIVPSAFAFAEDLKAFVREINSEWIVTCLDLGHAALVGREPEDEIRILGEDLYALHIHDTDYKADLHTLPYHGKHNWENICAALKEINYKGEFNFETGMTLRAIPDELYPLTLKYMYGVGEYLASKCE